MKNLVITLLSVFLLFSCSEHKKRGETLSLDRDDSVVVNKNYEQLIDSKQKAQKDTVYHRSEAYRYSQETYHRAIAEKTRGMSHAARLIYQYGVAIDALYEAQQKARHHPSSQQERKVQMLGIEAMQLYNQIKTIHLTRPEQQRFKELNKK
jgi:hypothetical protein